MTSGSPRSAAESGAGSRVHVGVAEADVASTGAVLVTNGVGSCIAVGLHDDAAAIGGLAHPMLPARRDERGPVAKYVAPCVEHLLAALVEAGASRANVVAKLAGGASILATTGEDVGARNVATATARLEALGVPVVGSDTGGDYGRIVALDTDGGAVTVKRAHGERLQL